MTHLESQIIGETLNNAKELFKKIEKLHAVLSQDTYLELSADAGWIESRLEILSKQPITAAGNDYDIRINGND